MVKWAWCSVCGEEIHTWGQLRKRWVHLMENARRKPPPAWSRLRDYDHKAVPR